jgi:hypothetical protein
LSGSTLANREFAQLPQNRDKLPGFRAIRGRLLLVTFFYSPHPCGSPLRGQLKLFNIAPAMLWRSKRKKLAIGETLLKQSKQQLATK